MVGCLAVSRRPPFARRLALLALTFAAFWPALASAQQAHAVPLSREVIVTIDNFSFNPPELTVPPGTVVTWVNRDDIPHTVVDAGKSFRSRALDTDDRFSITFASVGDFVYFCSLHPHMTGTVKVRGAAEGPAAASRATGPAP